MFCFLQLWISGRASVLLAEDRWFDFPGLHFEVSLGRILKPKVLLLVGTLHGSHTIRECMYDLLYVTLDKRV